MQEMEEQQNLIIKVRKQYPYLREAMVNLILSVFLLQTTVCYVYIFFWLITFVLVLDPDDANYATRKRKNIQSELHNTNIKRIGTIPLFILQLQLTLLFN